MATKKSKGTGIKKGMTFAEIMKKCPKAIEILLGKGMHCIGCPMAMQETLEQGATAHGFDADRLVEEINMRLGKK